MHGIYIYEPEMRINKVPEGIDQLIKLGMMKPKRENYNKKEDYYEMSAFPGAEELFKTINNDASSVRKLVESFALTLNQNNLVNVYDVIEYVNGSTTKYYCLLNDKTVTEVKF